MSDKVRNPLNVILGSFLKRERISLSASSTVIAESLHMGDSIYRMVEAGSAALNINRLALVTATFYDSKIKFERLAKFVAGSQILDFLISENNTLQLALEVLAERDEDFEHFIERTSQLYQLEYGTDDFKVALIGAVQEVELFLKSENYRRNTYALDEKVFEVILGVPSIEIPNILTYLESLHNRQPIHVGRIAGDWEKSNKDFKWLRGLYLKPDIIIRDSNLEVFTYEYLLNPAFEKIQMIFIDSNATSAVLRKSFISKIQTLRKKLGKTPLTETQLKKIDFKIIKKNNKGVITKVDELLEMGDDIFPVLNAYWNFSLRTGIEVGFVGGAEEKGIKNYAINLTGAQSLSRVKIFDTIWNDV